MSSYYSFFLILWYYCPNWIMQMFRGLLYLECDCEYLRLVSGPNNKSLVLAVYTVSCMHLSLMLPCYMKTWQQRLPLPALLS